MKSAAHATVASAIPVIAGTALDSGGTFRSVSAEHATAQRLG